MTGWFNQLLQEFGQTLGLSNLSANSAGVAVLIYEKGERLFFEDFFNNDREQGLAVTLLHVSDGYDLLNELQTALRLCHFHNGSPIQIQAGLYGEKTLSLTVYIDRQQATVDYLETVISRLRKMSKNVFH